jgi:hypothetical protein
MISSQLLSRYLLNAKNHSIKVDNDLRLSSINLDIIVRFLSGIFHSRYIEERKGDKRWKRILWGQMW